MTDKEILFHSIHTELDLLSPLPTSKNIPSWFKKIKNVSNGSMTIKKCIPFLDSFMSGYHIPLPYDIFWNKAKQEFTSESEIVLNVDHSIDQVLGLQIPVGFEDQPHKWINNWYIKTPKGYSTLFIHPLNRPDLPFYSLSAIVDTDSHNLVIHFPFFIKKDFDGAIPAGTPIIQAIPFKRDSWKMKVIDTGEKFLNNYGNLENKDKVGAYKRFWWSRKKYE